jgi:hypothetical protein
MEPGSAGSHRQHEHHGGDQQGWNDRGLSQASSKVRDGTMMPRLSGVRTDQEMEPRRDARESQAQEQCQRK